MQTESIEQGPGLALLVYTNNKQKMATKKKALAKPRKKKVQKRQPIIQIATGKQGGGKTYTTKEEIKLYVTKYKRPVIIIDRNGEYKGILRIPYDVRNEDEAKRARCIVLTNRKAKIFRIVCKKDGWDTYTKDEMLTVLFDIAKFFRNGMIIAEEMNNYIRQGIPERFYSWFTNLRHAGIDFIGHFQRAGDPHPAVWGNAKVWRLHPTLDSVTRSSTKAKIPDYSLARIAEIALQRKINAGEKYPKVYADFDRYKIFGVTKVELEAAIRAYLSTEGKEEVRSTVAALDRRFSGFEQELSFVVGRKVNELK